MLVVCAVLGRAGLALLLDCSCLICSCLIAWCITGPCLLLCFAFGWADKWMSYQQLRWRLWVSCLGVLYMLHPKPTCGLGGEHVLLVGCVLICGLAYNSCSRRGLQEPCLYHEAGLGWQPAVYSNLLAVQTRPAGTSKTQTMLLAGLLLFAHVLYDLPSPRHRVPAVVCSDIV